MVSGSGTNLQAILDAVKADELNAEIAAVGADKPCTGLDRAAAAGVETFLIEPTGYADREQWNRALEEKIASYTPDYVVFAGFMRIVDAQLVARFENRIINTHPALLPSFPGAHGVRDALAHGVKITGLTVHFVDSGVDTGTIIAQAAVPVEAGDTEESLHERIKVQERQLLVRTLAEFAALPKTSKPLELPARMVPNPGACGQY
mgnify:CR=1 FL=1